MGDVMAGWTLQTGYPLLTVSQHGDDQLSITQDRFLSDGSAGEGEWKMPIAVRFLPPKASALWQTDEVGMLP